MQDRDRSVIGVLQLRRNLARYCVELTVIQVLDAAMLARAQPQHRNACIASPSTAQSRHHHTLFHGSNIF